MSMRRDPSYPIDLAMLTQAVDEHCEKHRIIDLSDREMIAQRAIQIYQSGARTRDDIAGRLASTMNGKDGREPLDA